MWATRLLLCLAALVVSCTNGAPLPPGYIAVGLESGPLTLDPRFATDATAAQIDDLLFDGLTRLDDQSHRVPHLAATWKTPDPHTYIFHLHEGFHFADGQPLTAADVKATFDSVRQAATHSPKRQALDPL
jgi:peptide/nickel transport system substrate-binding protein